jgi:hypothetical protein
VAASLETPNRHTPPAARRRTGPGRTRRAPRTAGRSLVYCAALVPLAIGATVAALTGRGRVAIAWWRWLRTRVLGAPMPDATRTPGYFAVVGHALASVLLGTAALMPLSIEVVFLLRGVFYGLVDRGPYDTSWGGPTRAGAWLAHVLVGVPIAGVGLLALVGIAAVHQRLTVALDRGRPAGWLIPVTLVVSLAGTLLFVAWLHQV